MVSSILFVCSGNICRSPMAAGLFRHNLANVEMEVRASSAGLQALVGEAAVPEACEIMTELSIDISAHRARQLNQQMLLHSDLVLTMEEFQKEQIEKISPHVKGRVYLLGHWGGYEIPDTFQRPKSEFQHSLQQMEQSWQEWKSRLC